MITRQKIGQSGKTTTIIVAISFFRLPFGDKNMMKDQKAFPLWRSFYKFSEPFLLKIC